VAIGFFFLALARTTEDAGLWPLFAARTASVTLFIGLLLGSGGSLRMTGNLALLVILGGIVDMLANLLYLFGSRLGPLTLVVTLSSLYPASTVLLARFLLHERLSSRQWIGVALAMLAIVMIVTESGG
jgi:drug/metabolite transporter (DMT)-like permease